MNFAFYVFIDGGIVIVVQVQGISIDHWRKLFVHRVLLFLNLLIAFLSALFLLERRLNFMLGFIRFFNHLAYFLCLLYIGLIQSYFLKDSRGLLILHDILFLYLLIYTYLSISVGRRFISSIFRLISSAGRLTSSIYRLISSICRPICIFRLISICQLIWDDLWLLFFVLTIWCGFFLLNLLFV